MKTVCFSGRAQLLLKGAIYKYKDALLASSIYSLVPHQNMQSDILPSDVRVVSMHAGLPTIHAVFDWLKSKKVDGAGKASRNEACRMRGYYVIVCSHKSIQV